VAYSGLSDFDYGCGECPPSAAVCQDCTGTDGAETACNTEVQVKTFKCFDYTWDTATTAWKAAAEAGDCTVVSDADIICNKPGTAATESYTHRYGGCGECAPGAVDDNTCAECTTDSCNSAAATLAYLLAPVAALLFSLM